MTQSRVEPNAGLDRVAPAPSGGDPWVVLVGNPNVGKTSLFNRLSGERARVGNYPGVTIERREAKLRLPDKSSARLVDVPGTYSLSARSGEEQIALSSVLGIAQNPTPDLVVVVVDAGQLIRNLYLVLQLVELRLPMVLAINMIDEVDEPISIDVLSEEFGVRCVATNARTGQGVEDLRNAIAKGLEHPALPQRLKVEYPAELRERSATIAEAVPEDWLHWRLDSVSLEDRAERRHALALWGLTSIEADDELTDIPQSLREKCLELESEGADIDLEIIQARYAYLDALAERLHGERDRHPPKRPFSERIDRWLLHPVLGFVVFIGIMLVVFQSLFAWADPAIGLIESGVAALQGFIRTTFSDSILRDLVTEGIVGGVGNVIVFLPQILLLFFFIGLLEDSGYMARVAYLMDRIMKSLGLHGRAFVPMLSGFACAVPAIMATRTMERQRDRLLTMLVIPLMTCSARLPVYTLIIGALFPPSKAFGLLPVQGLLMVGMYVFAMAMTLGSAAVLGRTTVKGRRIPLILELPPYRFPNLRSILRSMFERSLAFLKEAGSVILVCTIALWALLYFPRAGEAPPNVDPVVHQAEALENSYAGRIGKGMEPAIKPLGFDWKIGVGLIGSFAAREVFVSTMALVYGVGEPEDEEAKPLREKIRAETKADGKPAYTPLVGFSLLIFFAIACQCMSTLAVVRRETRTWRWPLFMFAYMTVLAYVFSFAVYQGGKLLGFG
ncbi:MAG: ferrous iron transport protein B [Polyangiaceae bacterium]|nr:ferrous iron transport protein B [Polyangiaceae bacterium]